MRDFLPRPHTSDPRSASTRGALASGRAVWLLGLLMATLVLLSLGGESLRSSLQYERDAVLNGEYWRLLAAHFVHGGIQHLMLNLVGLILVAVLFSGAYTLAGWLLVGAFSVGAIGAGFVLYEPQLQWYVGFSGVLHGAMAAGSIALWRQGLRTPAFGVALVVAAKLLWEQWHGAAPLAGGMAVVVDAHLYGAVGGALAGVSLLLLQKRWPFRRSSL